MLFQKFKKITESFVKCGIILSFMIFIACGGGSGGTSIQTENGTNKITADAGGTVTYNNAVKLTVPANSLSGDADIKIEAVNNAPSGDADTLSPAGQAYRFTPAGTTFSLNKPAVLEMSYDETVLAQKGYSADTLRIYYYDESLKEYVAVASYVDTTNKKIIAYVEHFTIYMAMAKVKLAGNNAPYAALQTQYRIP